VLLICGSVLTSSAEAKKLNVITATTDLAALAQEVGGDKIDVESIAKGYQDPHFVEAKPSFLLKLRHADLLVVVGLDLEIGWLPPLITQSRNSKIQVGADGYLDASLQAQILAKSGRYAAIVASGFVLCIDCLAMGDVGRQLLGYEGEGRIGSTCSAVWRGGGHGSHGEGADTGDARAGRNCEETSPRRVDCRRVCGWRAIHAISLDHWIPSGSTSFPSACLCVIQKV